MSSLTEFEIGNTLWKENKKKHLDDPNRIAEIFEESLMGLSEIWVDSLIKVLAIVVN